MSPPTGTVPKFFERPNQNAFPSSQASPDTFRPSFSNNVSRGDQNNVRENGATRHPRHFQPIQILEDPSECPWWNPALNCFMIDENLNARLNSLQQNVQMLRRPSGWNDCVAFVEHNLDQSNASSRMQATSSTPTRVKNETKSNVGRNDPKHFPLNNLDIPSSNFSPDRMFIPNIRPDSDGTDDFTPDLRHEVAHLTRELNRIRVHQLKSDQEKTQLIQQHEHEIELLTSGLNHSFISLRILQNEIANLSKTVVRVAGQDQNISPNNTQQQLHQDPPNPFNNISFSRPPPSFPSDRQRGLYGWNNGSFELDLLNESVLSVFPPRPIWASANETLMDILPPRGTRGAELNNKVPPGNRANNYWDNFRSFSHQNRLSSVANPIVAEVPPQQQQINEERHSRHIDGRRDNFAGDALSAASSSPPLPRRKQKINREHNRNNGPSNLLSSLSSESGPNIESNSNRFASGQQTVRVFPMPQSRTQEMRQFDNTVRGAHALEPASQRQPDSSDANAAIKQSIYDCINKLISQHGQQPDYLANIFQNLKSLDKHETHRRPQPFGISLDEEPVQPVQQSPEQATLAPAHGIFNQRQPSRSFNLADANFSSDNENDVDRDAEDEAEDGNRLFNACKVTSNKRLEILTRPTRGSGDREATVSASGSTQQQRPLAAAANNDRSTGQKGSNVENRPWSCQEFSSQRFQPPSSIENSPQHRPFFQSASAAESLFPQPSNILKNLNGTIKNDGSLQPLNRYSVIIDRFLNVDLDENRLRNSSAAASVAGRSNIFTSGQQHPREEAEALDNLGLEEEDDFLHENAVEAQNEAAEADWNRDEDVVRDDSPEEDGSSAVFVSALDFLQRHQQSEAEANQPADLVEEILNDGSIEAERREAASPAIPPENSSS